MKERILKAITPLVESRDEAERWYTLPNAWLDGESPAALVEQGRGDEVLAMIEQIETGGFA